MCLGTVNKHKPAVTEGKGYKIFRTRGKRLIPFIHGDQKYTRNRWYEADGSFVLASDQRSYDSGFHIYQQQDVPQLKRRLNIEWALDKEYVLAEVEYRDARAEGAQDRLPVVVARQMRILRVVATFA